MHDHPYDDNFPVRPVPLSTASGGPQTRTSAELHQPNYRAYKPLLIHWIVRILLGRTMLMDSLTAGSPSLARVAQVLDLPELTNRQCAVDVLRSRLEALEMDPRYTGPQGQRPDVGDCALKQNLKWLVQSTDLNAVEEELLELAVCLRSFSVLKIVLEPSNQLSLLDSSHALAELFQQDFEAVRRGLQHCSSLMQSGLIEHWVHGPSSVDRILRSPKTLVQNMQEDYPDGSAGMLRDMLDPVNSGALSLAHFGYLQKSTEVARAWISGALHSAKSRKPAGHMLVVGAPGLGKTEWVRALLLAEKIQGNEMLAITPVGRTLTGLERLDNLRLAMRLLAHAPHRVLVFDEADDIFSRRGALAGASDESTPERGSVSMVNRRASLNRLIETSCIPVLWIMNNAEVLDPAVLRRFDVVIQLEAMPRSAKLSLLKESLLSLPDTAAVQSDSAVSAHAMERWAEIDALSPALIARLAQVRQKAMSQGVAFGEVLCTHWLKHRLSDSTRAQRKLASASKVAPDWSNAFVNASQDMEALAQGLARTGSGRVLLYGIPGTGKTAFAYALARRLDKPLLEMRASDLLSPYVGETEQKIAAAFERALDNNSVLFLDEVDSFLARRDQAVRNWEVTQVNELLEQLGDFEGVVVLATNRLDALDAAVLRRMDAKVHLEALRPEQALDMLDVLVGQIGPLGSKGIPDITPAQQQRLRTLNPLTPGDFACVRRLLRFTPLSPQEEDPQHPHPLIDRLLDLLAEEVTHKSRGRSPLGFLAPFVNSSASPAV